MFRKYFTASSVESGNLVLLSKGRFDLLVKLQAEIGKAIFLLKEFKL